MYPAQASQHSGTKQPVTSRNQYRALFRHTFYLQVLLYFIPLLLLALFFHVQYRQIAAESAQAHLEVLAEHHAATLALFLRERQTNLANIIDAPELRAADDRGGFLASALERLRRTSDAFIDLAVVDKDGALLGYAGPLDYDASVNYRDDAWFKRLLDTPKAAVITDVYLGFRNRPHFTIAIKRTEEGPANILRAALSPEKINDFLNSLEGAAEVHASVINEAGVFQVVTPNAGIPLSLSPYAPPKSPVVGLVPDSEGRTGPYAYSWLDEVPWALIVESGQADETASALLGMPKRILWIMFFFFMAVGIIIVTRTRQLVQKQLAYEATQAELSGQLAQAAKLASVGELAAGVAHEINNPLAIIAEEVGLIKDGLDDPLPEGEPPPDLAAHLDIIHDAVFRCRDITRKLLTFVRKTDIRIDRHHPHDIVDEVLNGMLSNEIQLASVAVERAFDGDVRPVETDRNQLLQVIINIVKNAVDAMETGGVLRVRTVHSGDHVALHFSDSGCGMTKEQLESAVLPFYTTKEPGKGTGLGLSVSYNIIKNFGGDICIDSEPNRGTTITVRLPYDLQR